MKKLIFFALATILIVSGVLVGCGSSTTTTTTTTPTAPSTTTQPAATTTQPTVAPTTTTAANPLGDLARPSGGTSGGTLQLVGLGNIANMGDPNIISNPGDATYAFPCIEPLLIIGPDGNIQPWLAEKYEIAPDGSSITLYLRQGIKFTDGTSFNATAAKYNIDNGINSKVWPNLHTVASCDVIDNYTVKINFKDGKFDWGATKSLAGFFSCDMFSPTSLETHDEQWQRTHVVGTGPFILTNYQRDQKLTYVRNTDYWRGEPYLDGIVYNIIPDSNTQLLAYKSGEVDAIGVQPSDAKGLLDSGFKIEQSTGTVYNLCLIPSSNNPDSPFAKLKVRQAVEAALNKDALVQGLTYGYGQVSNQEFLKGMASYADNVTGNPYNVTRAKQLLTEAGYPNGFQTTIWMFNAIPQDVPLAVQQQLAAVGITAKIQEISMIQMNGMVAKGGQGWEGLMYSVGITGSAVDPASTFLNGALNGNTTWISCNEPPEMLKLAGEAAAEINQAKRNQMYQALDYLMEDVYCQWIFMYWTPSLTSVAPNVHGTTIGQNTEFFPYTFAWKSG